MKNLMICEHGNSKYCVVIDKDSADSVRAAQVLTEAVCKVCDITLPILDDKASAPMAYEIIVGKTNREGMYFSVDREAMMEIGYCLSVQDKRLVLTGGERNGATFAVYEFIKRFLRYDPFHPYKTIEKVKTVSIPGNFYFENAPHRWLENMPAYQGKGACIYMIPSFLRPSDSAAMRGMGFVIRSANGKVAVIDGGNRADAPTIIEALKQLTGSEVPEVEGWYMTHIHSDHIDAFLHIGETMSDAIKVKCFYHNTPTKEYCAKWNEQDRYERLQELKQRGFCPFQRLNIGDRFHFDGVDVEIVYAFDRELEEYLNRRIAASEVSINSPAGDAINNSDTLLKFTADGHSALFVGDFMHFGEDFLYECHPEVLPNLKADIIQVGHHGANFLSQKFYHYVNARVALWSTTHESWLFSEGSLKSIRRRLYQLRLLKNYLSADGIYPIPFDLSEITQADQTCYLAELDEIAFSAGKTDSLLVSHKYHYKLFLEKEGPLTICARPFHKSAKVRVDVNGKKVSPRVCYGDIIGVSVEEGDISHHYSYEVLPFPDKAEVLHCDMTQSEEEQIPFVVEKDRSCFRPSKGHCFKISNTELAFGNGEFTISVWIKPDQINQPSTIYYYGDHGKKDPHYTLGFSKIKPAPRKPQIGAPVFQICDPTDRKFIELYASHSLKEGEWAQVVIVHENINQKIYINGEFSCERSWGTYVDIAGKNEFLIGCAPDGQQPFLGAIGTLSIYNYAMNDEEIMQQYKHNR